MPKAFHLSFGAARHAHLNPSDAPRPAPFAPEPSWASELIPLALFSCVGLLTLLIVLLIGRQGLWY
jgi:hypothetical protein